MPCMPVQGSPACHTVGRPSTNTLEWRAGGAIVGQLQYHGPGAPCLLNAELVRESSPAGSGGTSLSPQPRRSSANWTQVADVAKPWRIDTLHLQSSTCPPPPVGPLALGPFQGRYRYYLSHLSPQGFSHRTAFSTL